jgi:hypothetical protein
MYSYGKLSLRARLDSKRTNGMAYPQELNSKIKIRNNFWYRNIADCEGFDVVEVGPISLTLVRNRPSTIKLAGQAEFLASLPSELISAALADVTVVSAS